VSPLPALSTQTKICRFVDQQQNGEMHQIKAQNIKLEELQKPYM
jgi:hypothetical protein